MFQSCWWLITMLVAVVGASDERGDLYFLPMSKAGCTSSPSVTTMRGRSCSGWGWRCLLGQLEQLLQSRPGDAWRRYSLRNFVKSGLSLWRLAVTTGAGDAWGMDRDYGRDGAGAGQHGGDIAPLRAGASGYPVDQLWMEPCIASRRFAGWRGRQWRFWAFRWAMRLNIQGTLMAVGYALGIYAGCGDLWHGADGVADCAADRAAGEQYSVAGAFDCVWCRRPADWCATLHRRACQIALFISLAVVLSVIDDSGTVRFCTTGPTARCRLARG